MTVGRVLSVAGVRTSVRTTWTVVRLIVLLFNVCTVKLVLVLVTSNRVRFAGRPVVVFARRRLMLLSNRPSSRLVRTWRKCLMLVLLNCWRGLLVKSNG